MPGDTRLSGDESKANGTRSAGSERKAGGRFSGSTQLRGVLLALTGTLLFGLNASTTKVVMQVGFTPEQMVGWRSFATTVLAGLVILVTKPSSLRITRKEIPLLLAFGLIGVAFLQLAYSYAVKLLPVGTALLIEYTAIVWVPLTAMVIYRTRATKSIWFGVASVLAGLVIVAGLWQTQLSPLGVLAGFAAAAFLTCYFLLGEKVQRTRDSYSTLFYSMLISCTLFTAINPWWTPLGEHAQAEVAFATVFGQLQVPFLLVVAFIGVCGSFLPMLLSYRAMRLISPTHMGVISTVEVLFAFAFGALLLAEGLDLSQIIGGALVLAGILITQLSPTKAKAQDA